MSSTKFHIRFGLLIILVIGLFAVPITIVINKRATNSLTDISAKQHSSTGAARATDAQAQTASVTNTSADPATQESDRAMSVQRSAAAAGEWVVVDCEQRTVTQCPHMLQPKGQTPDYPPTQTTVVYRGSCRDVSILITSFCP